jgi:RNA recognition motif-containing protein
MKLYVGNVPYQATESDLQDLFAQTGATVDNVSIVRDRYSGEPRGFAFVEIADADEAQRAIRAVNGRDFLGRTLVVNEARPPREAGSGGGRGRPGGGRPGGRGPRRDY